MKIETVIVVYNRELSDSPSYAGLKNAGLKDDADLKYTGVGITVCDNSTIHTQNAATASSDGFRYINMNGNAGLTKAYNTAFKELRDIGDDDVVCLFDDDTKIPDGYFRSLKKAINENPTAGAYLPVVREAANGLIMSPCIINGCRVSRATDPFSIPQGKLTAINSGLALRGSVIKRAHYNENIFLDYADHDYLRYLRRINISLAVFDSPLVQNFSRSGKVSRASAEKRFEIFKKDFTTFCSEGSIVDRIYCKLYLARRRMEICRMTDDIQKTNGQERT